MRCLLSELYYCIFKRGGKNSTIFPLISVKWDWRSSRRAFYDKFLPNYYWTWNLTVIDSSHFLLDSLFSFKMQNSLGRVWPFSPSFHRGEVPHWLVLAGGHWVLILGGGKGGAKSEKGETTGVKFAALMMVPLVPTLAFGLLWSLSKLPLQSRECSRIASE